MALCLQRSLADQNSNRETARGCFLMADHIHMVMRNVMSLKSHIGATKCLIQSGKKGFIPLALLRNCLKAALNKDACRAKAPEANGSQRFDLGGMLRCLAPITAALFARTVVIGA